MLFLILLKTIHSNLFHSYSFKDLKVISSWKIMSLRPGVVHHQAIFTGRAVDWETQARGSTSHIHVSAGWPLDVWCCADFLWIQFSLELRRWIQEIQSTPFIFPKVCHDGVLIMWGYLTVSSVEVNLTIMKP